jgi:hypothetical protein
MLKIRLFNINGVILYELLVIIFKITAYGKQQFRFKKDK